MTTLLQKIQLLFIIFFIPTFAIAQCSDGYISLGTNLSFETPVMGCNNPSYIIIDDAFLPGWNSTANGGNSRTCNNEDNQAYNTPGQNNVELWMSGFQGVASVDGNQFMELNAHSGGVFTQDLPVFAECYDVSWSFQHRGRQGVDSLKITIIGGSTVYVEQTVGTGRHNWQEYAGTFSTIGVTSEFKISFETVSTHNGKASIGNFLDDVKFCVRPTGCTQLPVEMTAFNARNQENTVALDWITASELNNVGFEVQRSQDAQNWETLDFVSGNMTTTATSYYNWIDRAPLSGLSYYRLKQIDTDGQFAYEKVVSIERTTKGNVEFNVYPNPATDWVTINANQTIEMVTLYDLTGKLILTADVQDTFAQLNVQALEAGQYFARVLLENGTTSTQTIQKK